MPDNIESRMNFIIEQQAQFAADIQLLKERESQILGMIEANTGLIRQLVDVTFSLARHSEETDRRLEETDRRIQELVESDRRFAASMQELRDSQAHSDRRLDALITVVDKLARRNGPKA
jgi:DNA repair ATPase RecN